MMQADFGFRIARETRSTGKALKSPRDASDGCLKTFGYSINKKIS